MGLRPTNSDEKHAGGECRANMAGLRACFSGERMNAGAGQVNSRQFLSGADAWLCTLEARAGPPVRLRGCTQGPTRASAAGQGTRPTLP